MSDERSNVDSRKRDVFMKPRLRQVLAESDVAAVTIVLFLLWALDATCRGLWDPLYRAGAFIFTAIAILDIPYIPPSLDMGDRLMLIATGYFLYSAVACVLGASLLSRWVYGVGPIRALTACRGRLTGRKDV